MPSASSMILWSIFEVELVFVNILPVLLEEDEREESGEVLVELEAGDTIVSNLAEGVGCVGSTATTCLSIKL